MSLTLLLRRGGGGSPVSGGDAAPLPSLGLLLATAGGSDVSVALTGEGAAFAHGTLTPDTSVALVGSAAVWAQGTLTPEISVALTGLAPTFAQGTLIPALSVPLVGSSASFAQGTLAPELSVTLGGEAATFSQGTLTPVTGVFVALTGLEIASALGTLAADLSAALLGSATAFSQGTVTAQGDQAPAAVLGAGRKRRRRRLLVEIDGRHFEVESEAQAFALLERAKEVAVRQIAAARAAPVRVEYGIKRPSIRTDSDALRPLVRQKRAEIVALYDALLRDLEIQYLLAKADEEDEEETLIRFLM
jgi:hypothetical protein